MALEGGTGATGPHVQYTVSTNDYPVFQQLNYGHNNIHLVYDAYYDGSWKSSDVCSNFNIAKAANQLQFRYASGYNTGNALTWSTGMSLNTSGHIIFSTSHTPTSASATDTAGTITWDACYLYVYTAQDTWKRVQLSSW